MNVNLCSNLITKHTESSSDMAKPGKLIKQHYLGGAVFQLAKSSFLIPIPGFTPFFTMCDTKCLYCTTGHRKNESFDVLVAFHGNPAGHVHNKVQTSHLQLTPPPT